MLIYTFLTPRGLYKKIEIQLIQNTFVNQWKDYLVAITAKVPEIDFFGSGITYNANYLKPTECIPFLHKILKNLSYFTSLNLEDYSKEVNEIRHLLFYPNQVCQSDLNKWHRIFTFLENKYLHVPMHWIPSDINFNEMWHHVQSINDSTHRMEGYTYPLLERRKKYKNKEQVSLCHTNASTVQLSSQVFSSENIKFLEGHSFNFLQEEYHYSVWLHEEITGKDQMKAWLDHDNLTEYDITGNMFMTPSITLDPKMIYASILDNQEFRNESIASGKKLNRYPLGNIVNQKEISDWIEIRNSKIININLDGICIWSKNASI